MRTLLIIVLGLGLAGFRLCSLCGGFFAVASLTETRSSMQGMVGVGLGFLVVAGLLAWGCWKALLRMLDKVPELPLQTLR